MTRMMTALSMGLILAATGVACAATPANTGDTATVHPAAAPAHALSVKPVAARTPAPGSVQDHLLAKLPGTVPNKVLDKLNNAIFVAGKELKLAQLRRDIAKAEEAAKQAKEGKSSSSQQNQFQDEPGFQHFGVAPAFPPQSVTPKQPKHTASVQYPTVRSIVGFNGDLDATMVMPDGHVIRVGKGDEIQGGFKVTSISASGVRVRHGKAVVLLTFGAPETISTGGSGEIMPDTMPNVPPPSASNNGHEPGAPKIPPPPGSVGAGSGN